MNQEFYPDIKQLVSLPAWETYEKLLEEERQAVIAMFENEINDNLVSLQGQMVALNRIMRLPNLLVQEHEERAHERLKETR